MKTKVQTHALFQTRQANGFLSFAIALMCSTGIMNAARLTVTSLADDGPGTLRNALAAADSGDTIGFGVRGTIFLTTGVLAITNNVHISGPGIKKLSINGQTLFPIFAVFSNVTASIADLTLTNGYNSTFSPEANGGAIRNSGNLTLTRCVVTESTSEFGDGGGVYNEGNLTVSECSISNNLAISGGGIAQHGTRTLIVDRSTINANRVLALWAAAFWSAAA